MVRRALAGVAVLVVTVACGSGDRGDAPNSAGPHGAEAKDSSSTDAERPNPVGRIVVAEREAIVVYGVDGSGHAEERVRMNTAGSKPGVTEDGRFAFTPETSDGATVAATLAILDVTSGRVSHLDCAGGCNAVVPAGGSTVAWLDGSTLVTADVATGDRADAVLPALPWPLTADTGATQGMDDHVPALLAVRDGQAVAGLTGTGASGWPTRMYWIHDGAVEELGDSGGNRDVGMVEFAPDGGSVRYVAGWHESAPCNGSTVETYSLASHQRTESADLMGGNPVFISAAGYQADGSYRVTAYRNIYCRSDARTDATLQGWVDRGNGWEGPTDPGMLQRWRLPGADGRPDVVVEQRGNPFTATISVAGDSRAFDPGVRIIAVVRDV